MWMISGRWWDLEFERAVWRLGSNWHVGFEYVAIETREIDQVTTEDRFAGEETEIYGLIAARISQWRKNKPQLFAFPEFTEKKLLDVGVTRKTRNFLNHG